MYVYTSVCPCVDSDPVSESVYGRYFHKVACTFLGKFNLVSSNGRNVTLQQLFLLRAQKWGGKMLLKENTIRRAIPGIKRSALKAQWFCSGLHIRHYLNVTERSHRNCGKMGLARSCSRSAPEKLGKGRIWKVLSSSYIHSAPARLWFLSSSRLAGVNYGGLTPLILHFGPNALWN